MQFKKEIYQFIYFVKKLLNYDIKKEKIEKISDDKITCLSNEDLMIKRISNACNYLFSNINQIFNEDIINQCYFLISNSLLDKTIIKNIVSLYYQNIDNSPYTLAGLIHLFIINNIKQTEIEFAFIISNYIMIKKQKGLLIPYEYCIKKYYDIITNNDLSSLILLFFDIEKKIKVKRNCNLTKKEVCIIIQKLKNELVAKYDIKKLYLFGSYAKGTNNNYSDIDFIVIFNKDMINESRLDKIDEVKQYLINVLNCEIDILDFNYAIENLGENEMEHIITLI